MSATTASWSIENWEAKVAGNWQAKQSKGAEEGGKTARVLSPQPTSTLELTGRILPADARHSPHCKSIVVNFWLQKTSDSSNFTILMQQRSVGIVAGAKWYFWFGCAAVNISDEIHPLVMLRFYSASA